MLIQFINPCLLTILKDFEFNYAKILYLNINLKYFSLNIKTNETTLGLN